MLEYSFHSYYLQLFLAAVIYGLLNASRAGVVRGVGMVFWERLHPGLFTFRGTATREGGLVVGREVAKKGGEGLEGGEPSVEGGRFKSLISENLDTLLPRYQMMGVPQVLFALALNVPWLYLVKTVGYDIAYKP